MSCDSANLQKASPLSTTPGHIVFLYLITLEFENTSIEAVVNKSNFIQNNKLMYVAWNHLLSGNPGNSGG